MPNKTKFSFVGNEEFDSDEDEELTSMDNFWVDEDEELVNNLFTAIEKIDGIKENLNTALNESITEPITIDKASDINLSIEELCSKIKMDYTPVFCLESLHSPIAKKEAIKVALEGFTDRIMDIIRKIINWIKAICTMVYDDIEHCFRGAQSTAKHAHKIIEHAIAKQALKSSNNSKITKNSLRVFFNTSGKAMSASEIKEAYKSYNDEMNNSFSGIILHNTLANVFNTMAGINKNKSSSEFTEEDALRASHNGLMYFEHNALKAFTKTNPINGNDTFEYKLPFCNARLVIILSKIKEFYNTVSLEDIKLSKIRASELPILTPKEVIDLATLIEAQMNVGIYKDVNKIKSQIKEINKLVSKSCDDIMKSKQTNSNVDLTSLHFLKTISGTLIKLTKYLYRYNGATNRAILTYCEKSLSSWK